MRLKGIAQVRWFNQCKKIQPEPNTCILLMKDSELILLFTPQWRFAFPPQLRLRLLHNQLQTSHLRQRSRKVTQWLLLSGVPWLGWLSLLSLVTWFGDAVTVKIRLRDTASCDNIMQIHVKIEDQCSRTYSFLKRKTTNKAHYKDGSRFKSLACCLQSV